MNLPAPPPALPSETPAKQVSTREGILNAAERLFSEHGFERTSVRDITKAAGVNLGAINYYFGTKEHLAVEVYSRRLAPVNRERIEKLDALEAEAGGRPLKLDQLVEAIIRPAMTNENASSSHGDDLLRLITRCFQEPNPELKKFVEQQFTEVARRFDSALLRAVPGLPPGELFWRMNFLMGALHRGQEMWLRFDQIPHPEGSPATRPDFEGLIQRLISFAAAGLSARFPEDS